MNIQLPRVYLVSSVLVYVESHVKSRTLSYMAVIENPAS